MVIDLPIHLQQRSQHISTANRSTKSWVSCWSHPTNIWFWKTCKKNNVLQIQESCRLVSICRCRCISRKSSRKSQHKAQMIRGSNFFCWSWCFVAKHLYSGCRYGLPSVVYPCASFLTEKRGSHRNSNGFKHDLVIFGWSLHWVGP